MDPEDGAPPLTGALLKSRARHPGRPIHGVLLLDKPAGVSSNGALQQAKSLFSAAKAGHGGTLDPMATGLLPVCFGEATKFSHGLLDADKTYEAVIGLGRRTTTGDREGEVLEVREVRVDPASLASVLSRFRGKMAQVPPMYSALKRRGKPLYAYARAGIEVERKARMVEIRRLVLDSFRGDELSVTVECSKGTYIRVLAQDIGTALGCGAYLKELRRVAVGRFRVSQAVTLEELARMPEIQRGACLRPVDCLLQGLPEVRLDEESAALLAQGRPVWSRDLAPSGIVRLYGAGDRFLGVGEGDGSGKIAPKRLLGLPPATPLPETQVQKSQGVS